MHTREQRQRILDEYERGGVIGRSSQRYATWKYQTFANWVQCRKGHISFYFFSTFFCRFLTALTGFGPVLDEGELCLSQ
jgi:hypothetical protein